MSFQFTEEQKQRIRNSMKNDVRFKGLSMEDAEALAWALMYKWKEDAKNFLVNLRNDVTMLAESLTGKK
jgi:hypothetical protein